MGRVDRLQNAVEAIRDDVGVNFGRADHAASIGMGVRAEVQAIATQVSAMERQILRLRTEMDELRRGNP
jgi:outer membrane murein-binding lipoprotein Lpp